ncbi:GNAT family N-acetyltransferase [Gilvimarinus chinensis]|uniref:GNAT family N-acetyltransferase n=1 Tax=Gilvimarinus chinensis TaxID=396005 RepID=UPI00036F9738|nr:GNAT family N-acetyltransferase [Gilvimarinus chinensis]
MIRNAKPEDFGAILRLSESFWQHTQFEEPFEPEHTRLYVQMAHDHGLLAVVEISGEVVGFCAAIRSPLMGSTKAQVATELAWYVSPAHRGGRNGVALLKHMEQLAKAQGVKYWTMLYMESSMPDTVRKMYERLGYSKAETSYTKVL